MTLEFRMLLLIVIAAFENLVKTILPAAGFIAGIVLAIRWREKRWVGIALSAVSVLVFIAFLVVDYYQL